MSQILVVLLFVLWVAAAPERLSREPIDLQRLCAFLGILAVLVLIPGVVGRVQVRRIGLFDTWRSIRHFHWLIETCRFGIVVLFGVEVMIGGTWESVVGRVLGRAGDAPYTLPGMLLGPLPAIVAWVALWWAQYPMDRLAREQNLLGLLESDLPTHSPPTFRQFFGNNLRMQLLAAAIPLLLIALLRDSAALAIGATPWFRAEHPALATGLSFGATLLVLLIAPEPLRRILRTQRLSDPALRAKLDTLCRVARTRYREVLLWNTGYALGNAAVMGVLPQIRYVLLSDLLLETMDDQQIETVFAHELGHIVHRHTLWLVATIVALVMCMGVGGELTAMWLERLELPTWSHATIGAFVFVCWLGMAIAGFGFISRRFERQADVYAARVMQQMIEPNAHSLDPRLAPVGPHGAAALASALHRAAEINHMPVDAMSFRHGSIASRVRYIHRLTGDESLTRQFDRSMMLLYAAVIAGLAVSLAAVAWMAWGR